jgi:hypothetical protein
MAEINGQPSDAGGEAAAAAPMVRSFGLRDWALLIAAAVGSVALFQFLARLLRWPIFPGYSASLLASANLGAGLIALAIGLLATLIVGMLLLGWLRAEAGLFVAAIGLAALANRGGTVGALLRWSQRPQLYLTFVGETVMLLAAMGLAWEVTSLFARRGWLAKSAEDPDTDLHPSLVRCVLASLAQAIVTALLVHVLAQNDSLKQSLAAVAVASLIGAIVAHQLLPLPTSAPFWVGPFLVGIGGYGWAHVSPGHWQIGLPPNPLACVPPLGYASLGTAGAIFGYWMSRKWRAMDTEEEFLPEDAVD